MAKDITKLLSQKPQWIQVDEPVSGSTNPAAQDSTVLSDGTITHNVEGVDNRTPAQLWGIIKLFSDIFTAGHADDGSHALTAADIAAGAGIEESKLLLDIYSENRPDTATPYTSTTDIATLINTMWPYAERALRNAQLDYSEQYRTRLAYDKVMPTAWEEKTGGLAGMTGSDTEILVADDEYVWISGYRIRLYGSFDTGSACKLNIGEASGRSTPPLTVSDQKVVSLEIWEHNISTTGYAFPYGNIQYRNQDEVAGTHGINFDHTTEVVSISDPSFNDFSANPDNNVMFNSDAELIQIVYCLKSTSVDYNLLANKTGIDDPNYRTFHSNKTVVPSTDYLNCWVPGDGSEDTVITPVGILCRRNMGIYHEAVNPAGAGLLRTGEAVPTTFSQCFDMARQSYYDAGGTECPDYVTATYDSGTDTYELLGTTYYRSGLSITTVTGHPLGYFADILVSDDLISMQRMIADDDKALFLSEQKMLAGQLEAQLMPVLYGTVTSMNKCVHFSKLPYQVIGFGTSESFVFGTNNVGAVFIDKTNNGSSGLVDQARRCWIDHEVDLPVSFSFTEGISNDESKPDLCTFEPGSGTVTLNTTGLSATPPFSNVTPTMYWENGDVVSLSSPWSGITDPLTSPSQSASCVISAGDLSSHTGQRVYGICTLYYERGSGTPFRIWNPLDVKTLAGTSFAIMDSEEVPLYENYSFAGTTTVQANCTDTIIELDPSASGTIGAYVNEYAYFPTIGSGEWRKVVSYDPTLKRITLETALSLVPPDTTQVSIGKMIPENNGYIIIDKLSRGVNSGIKRKRVIANASGVAIVDRNIRHASNGTINGGIVTGLSASEEIEVIYDMEIPFQDGFKLYMTHKPQFTQFQGIDAGDNYEIVKIGHLLTTNIGSANTPDDAYLLFMPTYTVPVSDNVTWVGTLDSGLQFNITNLKSVAWNQILPTEGLVIDGSTVTVNFDIGEGYVDLISPSQISSPNSAVFAGTMLVRSQNTKRYYLMISVRYDGYFGFDSTNNVYLVEVLDKYAIFTN